ncbi:RBBP9/YdeN family alpha/beta hydrolase [Crenobacter cavernae]|uniref:Alpha/beta hydrolase n=1 Tax=Crenobacter cavernae TaxID=2290923 RepID=A0ABY0FE96_9NEIS|nr:alpha/beta hydrolase [Crenobacter cavernae]RXZ44560.1 alpha/beta hydrolase [Crenobacter cavernae]
MLDDDDITLVIVPGWQDSGPNHWQTLWERGYPLSRRVDQADWETPVRAHWVAALDALLADIDGPVVIAAHSLGVATVAHWAAGHDYAAFRRVKGALLVAPPDVERAGFAASIPASGYAPLPAMRLPFPAIVVASRSDPFCDYARAEAFAKAWGARLVDAGDAGHINTAAGYGSWPAGQRLLQTLMLG